MTKYEEMPLDTELQHGDRVTFSQPRQGEFLVLFACIHRDGRMGVILADEFMGIGELLHKGLKVTYVSRPIPGVVLPTVPGYYEAGEFPLVDGFYAYRLRNSGRWYNSIGGELTEEKMRSLMPLTRLVPETEAAPAKLADRIDLYELGKKIRDAAGNSSTWKENAARIVAAIDGGGLDK